MTTYHVAYDLNGHIVCVSDAPTQPTALGRSLAWLCIEADEPPRSHGHRVIAGKLTKVDEAPVQPLPAVNPPPSKEQFLEALYQQALGNDAPMKAFNLTVAIRQGSKK